MTSIQVMVPSPWLQAKGARLTEALEAIAASKSHPEAVRLAVDALAREANGAGA